jgi:hypothetical protein
MDNLPEIKEKTFVFREIDGAYIVWFANGNQYLRLEEPAFFVFQNIERGTEQKQIAKECASRYHNTEQESARFVAEIIAGIETIRQNSVSQKEIKKIKEPAIQENTFVPGLVHWYRINKKYFCFQFETRFHEFCLHPLLQHLECESSPSGFILFELFNDRKKMVLRVNGEIEGSWKEDETHLMKGVAFLRILNTAYEKTDDDWMAIIHASAVSNGKKTMVFTASPGSGKSTIAALLQQKGLALVSDDFVAVERFSQHVFPFPAAMSVKEGASEMLSAFYPSLKEQEATQRSLTNKLVKYLPIEGVSVPAPVQEIIFIKYDPEVDFEMEKRPRADALKLLLDETWTFPSAENADRFLDWYSRLSCYRLNYSNNEKAIQAIIELFEQ